MVTKLKLWYSTIKNTYKFIRSASDSFYDYYMRHHKVIGWYRGLPVYSAFLNPGMSEALGNLFSRRVIGDLIGRELPTMVNIAVTDICNAKCEHCSFYSAMDKPGEKVLSTDQMKSVIKECQDFGIAIMNFVGGEPLLRKDLCELIEFIDKEKTTSSIFTNGWFLKEKAKGLKMSGVMMVITSLDSVDSEKHDKFRRLPGLFHRAIDGIKECQKNKLLTGISTTVTQEDLLNGDFEKMIHFAKELSVNELIVIDTMPIGMYSHREDLSRNKIDRLKLLSLVDKYNSKKNYPGIFCYAHFRDQSAFGCSAGRNYFYISPYGEIHPCDFTAKPIGSLLIEPISTLWFKLNDQRKSMNGHYANQCCSQEPLKIKIN